MSKEVKIPKQVQALLDAEAPVQTPETVSVLPAGAEVILKPVEQAVQIAEVLPAAGAQRFSYEQILSLPHEKLAQMYSTLQGKYHAEVHPLTQRIRDLEAENEQLKLQPSAVNTRSIAEDLDEETREEVGPEVLSVVQRMETRLRSEMEERSKKERFAHFVGLMETLVPDVRTHNSDPEFIAWLAAAEPGAVEPRNIGFQRAVAAYDAHGAAVYFKTWIASKQPPVVSRMDEVVVPPGAGGQSELSDKPAVKESFIAKFYQDLAKGMYRNNPEEARRIEMVIEAAVMEGRVTKG